MERSVDSEENLDSSYNISPSFITIETLRHDSSLEDFNPPNTNVESSSLTLDDDDNDEDVLPTTSSHHLESTLDSIATWPAWASQSLIMLWIF